MHFDALTLACVTDELQQSVAGGRVQQVLAPDTQSIGLELYAQRQRHYLLLAASGQASHVYLCQQKLRRGVEQPSPLLLLLRKYVRDSLLINIVQPDQTERLLQLDFDHPQHGATTLIMEILGQRSNLLLVNAAGRILDCLQRVWPETEGQRILAPGQSYRPPPRQNKLSPVDDGSPDYYARLAVVTQQQGKLWKTLTTHLAGVSPSQGRELAWRVMGDAEAETTGVDLLALIQALQSLWERRQSHTWQPGIWQVAGQVVGFSPYPAHVRGEFMPVASLSAALEQFYATQQTKTDGLGLDMYAGLRATVTAEVRRAQERIQRQLDGLTQDEPAPGAAEQLRSEANWLLALHTQVQPGQTSLEVDLGDGRLQITLDPTKRPIEQAEQMFKRAARLARAAKIIPERRAKLLQSLDFLAQLAVDLTLAENQPEIAVVREELQKAGLGARQNKAKPPERVSSAVSQPRRYYSVQGLEILVGRNARQNEAVTFDIANASDLWLHVRGAPGSHVVIRSGGQRVDEQTLQMAAQLAAYYSSLRGELSAPVSYTARRFVTRVPGGNTGQVYTRSEQTLYVPARLPQAA
jgi:predicted ribosome quality control (RQC) complex YloA/Tae2 family protein